jgi:hypothetical protein
MTRPARARDAGAGGASSWAVKSNFVIATLVTGPGLAGAIEPPSGGRRRLIGRLHARGRIPPSAHCRYAGIPIWPCKAAAPADFDPWLAPLKSQYRRLELTRQIPYRSEIQTF